jgi:hypothetical protein
VDSLRALVQRLFWQACRKEIESNARRHQRILEYSEAVQVMDKVQL